jgi:hypothetical protein
MLRFLEKKKYLRSQRQCSATAGLRRNDLKVSKEKSGCMPASSEQTYLEVGAST